MKLIHPHASLLTDLYQLTMAQAYFLSQTHTQRASFDYFFRKIPFQGGFVVFAGLHEILETLEQLHFDETQIRFLRSKGFHNDFLEYLRNFRFKGDVWTVKEGEIIFPLEPVMRLDGTIVECQLAETLLLNFINFQSLIATKAARIVHASRGRILSDFGLRRAHSLGGVHASRAAIIGGFHSTSNVLAGQWFDLELSGTMGHAFIESFESEEQAFRNYAQAFPHKSVFLVDTYNTLKSGIPAAIKVAKEMREKGHQLLGIRLDSGDLAYLSKKARKMLDEAGLMDVKIIVSNQLDERVIRSLLEQNAPIDVFGVGTSLVTGNPDAALDGVFKLSMAAGRPRLKISDNTRKTSLPGQKKILRFFDNENRFYADTICLIDEQQPERMIHPFEPEKSISLKGFRSEEILHCFIKSGRCLIPTPPLSEIATYARERLLLLPEEHQRFDFPHIYKVGVSPGLSDLKQELIKKHQSSQ